MEKRKMSSIYQLLLRQWPAVLLLAIIALLCCALLCAGALALCALVDGFKRNRASVPFLVWYYGVPAPASRGLWRRERSAAVREGRHA
jgi:hypothetical protein